MQESENVLIDGCMSPFPEGLKELMSDVTREVLRAQPSNVYAFIANYLSALLQVRSSVTIAGQVCDDLHYCSCQPELDEALRSIGLLDEDVETTTRFIETFLENGGGKETSLLVQLMKNTSIEESQVEAIQRAVRTASQRHHLAKCNLCENPSTALEPKCIDNVSSVSLAGSFVNLPKHIPYSVHNDALSDISERAYDTHTSQYNDKEFKPTISDTVNTIYKRGAMEKENVIRFKTEIVKYVSDEELTEELSGQGPEVQGRRTFLKADSHSNASSDD